MEKDDLNQLLDLAAYIKTAAEDNVPKETILRHVEHDVNGLINKTEDKFWTPRTSNWAQEKQWVKEGDNSWL